MYDILQLNDMLVPELQDIAEQLAIPNFKKIDKQDLIYKILDNQSIMSSETKNGEEEKPKRKRTVKVATAAPTTTTTEQAPDAIEKPKAEQRTETRPDQKSNRKNQIKQLMTCILAASLLSN